jgi:hypothetical protein
VALLGQRDGLLRVSHAHREPAPSRGDAQVLVPQPPHQIEWLARRLLLRQTNRVFRHCLLDGLAYVRSRPEVAVCRHQSLDALMRALEIVVLDKQLQPALAVREVREYRARKEFLPQRLPEAFDLAQGLRVLRPALAMRDALAPQFLLKSRGPAPGRVLPALIGQHLLGDPEAGDAALQRFHHQLRLLVVRQRMPHDEARVVVHEAAQVQPLVSPQEEGEDVRLPQLIRLCSLKAPGQMLPRWRAHLRLGHQPGLVQDAAHFGLGNAQPLETPEHVADPLGAELRMLPPHGRHQLAFHCRARLCPRWRAPPLGL